MPTPTYTPLANLTLGATATTVTFSNIPATYRDLILVANGRSATASLTPRIRFNGDTANNYSWQRMSGTGTSAIASSGSTDGGIRANTPGASSTSAVLCFANIMDYSATDKHKTVLVRWDNAEAGSGTEATVGRWNNTVAITSVSIGSISTDTWAVGSTFALYGIVA